MLEQFMGAAVVVLVVVGLCWMYIFFTSCCISYIKVEESSEFNVDKNAIKPGIQIMYLDS